MSGHFGTIWHDPYYTSLTFKSIDDDDKVHNSTFDYMESEYRDMSVLGSSDKVTILYTRLGSLHTFTFYCYTREMILVEGDECHISLPPMKDATMMDDIIMTTCVAVCKDNVNMIRSAAIRPNHITIDARAGESVPDFSVSFNY